MDAGSWVVACILVSLLLASLFWLTSTRIDTPVFVRMIKKLVTAGNRDRAVKLCLAAGVQVPARNLTLYLLGLELPRKATLGEASGYRGYWPGQLFEDQIQQLAPQRATSCYQRTQRRGIAAVLSGTIAAGLCVMDHLLGWTPPIPEAPEYLLLYAAAAILLVTAATAKRWRVTMSGKAIVLQELVPLLRPLEEMSPVDLDAAAAARAALAGSPAPAPTAGVSNAAAAPNTCPSCGKPNQPHYRFCLGCGASLETSGVAAHSWSAPLEGVAATTDLRRCRACGKDNLPEFRFCSSCGAALDGSSTNEVAPSAEEGMKRCPACGKENQPHYRFCLGCGGEL